MNTTLSEFIQSQIILVSKSIKCREQASKSWRGGTDKSWRAVGCTMTKAQRLEVAQREERILVKLRHELESFQRVKEALISMKL
jgi:hypothetical protein